MPTPLVCHRCAFNVQVFVFVVINAFLGRRRFLSLFLFLFLSLSLLRIHSVPSRGGPIEAGPFPFPFPCPFPSVPSRGGPIGRAASVVATT